MAVEFSARSRQQFIDQAEGEVYDLFIIGGGINGAGIARDAASRGMKVFLAEASDFASGTSSKSSKLIHGGIRYLENYEFHLVFEALSERSLLFEIAPHLVHPLEFMFPLYKGARVGMNLMGLGMWLYDALSLFQAPELHKRFAPSEAVAFNPSIKADGLLGAYSYYDAYMDDDRLVLESLRSAAGFGAALVNFAKVTKIKFPEDGSQLPHYLVSVLDTKTNVAKTVQCKHICSCLGPWTDEILGEFVPKWQDILRPTKGIHLTFHKDKLPLNSAVVMTDKDRIVFAIPRNEMTIIGTTDTDYQNSPSKVRAEKEDIDYLLRVANEYFPKFALSRDKIISTYAGVRPLVRDDAGTSGKTSREHSILSPTKGLTVVAGGKYTTYRKIAEQTVDKILKSFSLEEKIQFRQPQTRLALDPEITGDGYKNAIDEAPFVQHPTLSQSEILELVLRHGAHAFELLNRFPNHTYWQIETIFTLETSMCLHFVDFMTRRTPLFLADTQHGIQFSDQILAVFADFYSLSPEQISRERQTYLDLVKAEAQLLQS